ncbi:MAG: CDC48 family AAA ATPase [Chloroflexi bacterium]|nr:CDC48 family AAA ATPase [Ktedonobacteraceae bacterium]MBV9021290.1 CDC48 family AAA ATPase [Ktedonobacteraceae bacterium]MBV9707652.1 CDC48 family AAA ATPase [Chloroflexota bacterium]
MTAFDKTSDSHTRITAKLSRQGTRGNTTPLDINKEDQDQQSRFVDNLHLTVIEGFQVGRGVARIDPDDMDRLGCQAGDIVLITGARTTAAKVVPIAPSDRGQQTIQMDSQVRQNSASGLGEHVVVRKAKVHTAEKVTVLPLSSGAPIQEADLQYIARYLVGLPVVIGDLLRIGTPGAAPRELLVISTTPATPAYTLHKRNTGEMPTLEMPTPPQPTNDVEAVLVQAGTVVRAQARGAASSTPGRVSYEDIGGLGKELQRIREMIELPLKYPAVFDRLGVEPPKGVLLYGPPGTGKTLIARVVAAETNAAFFVINGPEIINKFYGESESRLRSIFQEAQRRAPSIIFIDELDALAPKRTEIGGEVERRIVGQLLALMDGLASRGQIVVIGATNQPNALDSALRRPGRFDREIMLRVPDVRGRMEILRIHSRDAALANDIDFARLAQLTPGFVGADLEALCREAAMNALRRVLPHIDYQRGYIPYETLVNLSITMPDFQAALREIEPSTIREVYVEVSETSWDDIGGLEQVKELLTESVEWPLRYPELYANAHVEPPRGLLLTGPPGTGKTLIARALANQCEASFISIKGPELLSKWVGESEKGIREVFRRAKQAAPCIVFFDELDALAPRRGGSNDSNVGDRVIAQLLTEMDGIEGRAGVLVLAATNRPELIDPALLRPGRFDLVVELHAPNEVERQAIFAVHLRGRPIAPEVTVEELARLTAGRSGADIEAICRRASLLALREWITPRLDIGHVQVTEESAHSEEVTPPVLESMPSQPISTHLQIRPEHFARAIDEQHERYAVQEEADKARARQEEGRQRLIEMAAQREPERKVALRGFRLWLARLFRLI